MTSINHSQVQQNTMNMLVSLEAYVRIPAKRTINF